MSTVYSPTVADLLHQIGIESLALTRDTLEAARPSPSRSASTLAVGVRDKIDRLSSLVERLEAQLKAEACQGAAHDPINVDASAQGLPITLLEGLEWFVERRVDQTPASATLAALQRRGLIERRPPLGLSDADLTSRGRGVLLAAAGMGRFHARAVTRILNALGESQSS